MGVVFTGKRHNLTVARRIRLLAVRIVAARTIESDPGWRSVTLPSRQCDGGKMSFSSTRLFILSVPQFAFHLVRHYNSENELLGPALPKILLYLLDSLITGKSCLIDVS